MSELDRRVRRHLVLDMGFSRRNAEIALEMFRAGELSNTEKVVIEYTMLNPEPTREEARLYYVKGSDPVVWVTDHLNYRITQAGGEPVSRRYKR